MDYNLLIDEIIIKRKSKSITQEQLSKLTGITRSTLARIETKKSIPKIDTFIKIVNALDCSIIIDCV